MTWDDQTQLLFLPKIHIEIYMVYIILQGPLLQLSSHFSIKGL